MLINHNKKNMVTFLKREALNKSNIVITSNKMNKMLGSKDIKNIENFKTPTPVENQLLIRPNEYLQRNSLYKSSIFTGNQFLNKKQFDENVYRDNLKHNFYEENKNSFIFDINTQRYTNNRSDFSDVVIAKIKKNNAFNFYENNLSFKQSMLFEYQKKQISWNKMLVADFKNNEIVKTFEIENIPFLVKKDKNAFDFKKHIDKSEFKEKILINNSRVNKSESNLLEFLMLKNLEIKNSMFVKGSYNHTLLSMNDIDRTNTIEIMELSKMQANYLIEKAIASDYVNKITNTQITDIHTDTILTSIVNNAIMNCYDRKTVDYILKCEAKIRKTITIINWENIDNLKDDLTDTITQINMANKKGLGVENEIMIVFKDDKNMIDFDIELQDLNL